MNFVNVAGVSEAGGFATATLPDGSIIKTSVPLNGMARSELTLGIRPEYLVATTAEKGTFPVRSRRWRDWAIVRSSMSG